MNRCRIMSSTQTVDISRTVPTGASHVKLEPNVGDHQIRMQSLFVLFLGMWLRFE